MADVAGLQCLRCDTLLGVDHFNSDCPSCRDEAPSNLTVAYERAVSPVRPSGLWSGSNMLWRYGDILPVSLDQAVSLGEGGTPLHSLDRLGASLELPQLYAKDESRSPTWSFKDRLACVAVSVAKARGAPAVVSSSTGNAGAAIAAYAAKADLPCVVFTAKGGVGPLLTQMRVYGAIVVALEHKSDRWPAMQEAVERYGWFPTSPFFAPVVGSNPYGIEGYKTLAYEVVEQLNWQVPDWCILPVCYGDAMLGMWRGFLELHAAGWIDRLPRMAAAEIYGSLSAALESGSDALPDMTMTHDTVAKSTTATRSTYQALHVVRASGGVATTVGNDAIMTWQRRLAEQEGLYAEPAAAGALAAVAELRSASHIAPSDRVVALLTASGLKDTQATAEWWGDKEGAPVTLDAAAALVEN